MRRDRLNRAPPYPYTAPVPPVVIDNPILNSPFLEAIRHFRFSDEGITDEIAEGRRESGYFLPIASPRKKSGQMKFDTEWTQDRFFSSPRINRIRERVNQWRQGGYVGVTRALVDKALLDVAFGLELAAPRAVGRR